MGIEWDGAVWMGLTVYQGLRGSWYPWWWSVGFALGLVLNNAALAWAMGLTGLGLGQYAIALRAERDGARRAQQAELFLRRLQQMLIVKGSLSAALQDVSDRGQVPFRDSEADRMLWGVYRHWKVPVLGMVSHLASLIQHHGGSMEAVLTEAIRQSSRDRRRRHQRQMAEASKRMTILLLAVAPLGAVMMFWALLPPFYHALSHGPWGWITLGWTGLSGWGVLAVLTRHVGRSPVGASR